MTRRLAVALCLAVVSTATAAETPEVSVAASATPGRATVGDPITYVVRVEAPQGTAWSLKALEPLPEGIEMEPAGEEPVAESPSGTRVRAVRFLLRPFRTGPIRLPAPVVRVEGGEEISGAPVDLTIESVLTEGAETELAPAKPLLPIRMPWPWRLLAGLLAFAAAAAAAVWWSARDRTRPPVPPIPPHRRAAEALEALRRERLAEQGRYEEYYLRLSAIVRRYIEERFGLAAPEMTTEEFLQAAARGQTLTPDDQALLERFLVQSDLVKFARYRPSAGEAEEAFAAAVAFVDGTRPAEAVQPA